MTENQMPDPNVVYFRHLHLDGRPVATVCILPHEQVWWVGVAYCNERDQFNRSRGRAIAENRARTRTRKVVPHTRVLYSKEQYEAFHRALHCTATLLDPAAYGYEITSQMASEREAHVQIARNLAVRWREYKGARYEYQDTGEEELPKAPHASESEKHDFDVVVRAAVTTTTVTTPTAQG